MGGGGGGKEKEKQHVLDESLELTHIDNRVFELDVESVVGHGDDGVISAAQKLHCLPLKDWEGNLWTNTDTNRVTFKYQGFLLQHFTFKAATMTTTYHLD